MEYLSSEWLERVKRLQGPGEDLKYDDLFTRLKNMNAALTPDAAEMLALCELLLPRSSDWRICIYAIHASAIAGNADFFVNAFSAYDHIVCEKFNESFPPGISQKTSTFLWCNQSFIVDHLSRHSVSFSQEQSDLIRTGLARISHVIEEESGECLKWHKLDDWLSQQRAVNNQSAEKPQTQVSPPKKEHPEEFEHPREARPLIDKYIRSLLKEREYEKAIAISRAYRWCPLIIPKAENNKTECELRQEPIDEIRHKFERKDWESVIQASEELFLHPHAQYLILLQFWSCTALREMRQGPAAELIHLHLKKLYNNYGKIFSLMYNDGRMFAEPAVLTWVKQQCENDSRTIKHSPDIQEKNIMLTESDPQKIKTWLGQHSVSHKLDAYLRDYLQLKLLKIEGNDKDLNIALRALFDKSIREKLYDWDPCLAREIWNYVGSSLLQAKIKNKESERGGWQAQWEHLIGAVSEHDMLAATNLLKQS